MNAAARWTSSLATAALAAAALAGDAPAGPAAPPRVDDALVSAFPAQLGELAAWCDGAQVLAERNRVAEAMLLFDPDDARARAWLGFRAEGEGKWKRVPGPLAANLAKEALPEWERRRDDLTAPYRAMSPAARAMRWTSKDPKVAGLRDRVRRALVALAPDDAALRDLDGETHAGGRWILRETAATAAGRRRVADLARDARKAAAKAEAAWSREPDWVSVLSIGGFTVRSAFPKSDTEEIARGIVGARELFSRVFENEASIPDGLVVFLFADYWSHKRFLESRTDVKPERRKECLDLGNYWIGDGALVCYDEPQAERVDGLVRQTLSNVKSKIGRMYRASDWMGEGLGMYLTHALVGTRLTAFVQSTQYSDESVGREISDARSDWVALARRMVERGFEPKIPILVGTPLNSLTRDDGLFAYALGAYFLETRPSDAARLIARTQDGTNFHRALAETCGTDAEGLEVRFLRWLRETK